MSSYGMGTCIMGGESILTYRLNCSETGSSLLLALKFARAELISDVYEIIVLLMDRILSPGIMIP